MLLAGVAVAGFLGGALLGCAGNGQAVRRDSQTAYKLGLAFLAEGRPSPALRELTKADALTPNDPEILNALGLAYWARQEYATAEKKFLRATKVKPDFSEAWNNLGALYLAQRRYEEAVPVLKNALKNVFYGTQERALANLGWALYKLGRKDEAESRLRQAIEVAPRFPLAQKFLGIVLLEKGDYREALDRLNDALRLFPKDAETNLRKGICLVKLGDEKGARSAFENAWRLAPDSEVGKSAKMYLDLLQR